jgi:hypothetical protein
MLIAPLNLIAYRQQRAREVGRFIRVSDTTWDEATAAAMIVGRALRQALRPVYGRRFAGGMDVKKNKFIEVREAG